MNFKQWLENLSDEELDVLERQGLQLVDQFQAGGYLMYLLEVHNPIFPRDMKFQIGVQKKGMSAVDPYQQMEKNPNFSLYHGSGALDSMADKLNSWLREYGNIAIGSENNDKAKMWGRILQYLGFDVEEKMGSIGGMRYPYFLIKSERQA